MQHHSKRQITRELRKLITELVKSREPSAATINSFAERMRRLASPVPVEQFMEQFDQAVGTSTARKVASLELLGTMSDLPGAIDRISVYLDDPEWRVRSFALQVIAIYRLEVLADRLNDLILHDPDDVCRQEALRVAGLLKQAVNLPVIRTLLERNEPGLEWVLKDYLLAEAKPYLKNRFVNAASDAEKVVAAWALAKLEDPDALKYLASMLWDPHYTTPTSSVPGQSLRAAQAIADIFELPFEWNRDYVPVIREWWRRRQDPVQKPPADPDGRSQGEVGSDRF